MSHETLIIAEGRSGNNRNLSICVTPSRSIIAEGRSGNNRNNSARASATLFIIAEGRSGNNRNYTRRTPLSRVIIAEGRSGNNRNNSARASATLFIIAEGRSGNNRNALTPMPLPTTMPQVALTANARLAASDWPDATNDTRANTGHTTSGSAYQPANSAKSLILVVDTCTPTPKIATPVLTPTPTNNATAVHIDAAASSLVDVVFIGIATALGLIAPASTMIVRR